MTGRVPRRNRPGRDPALARVARLAYTGILRVALPLVFLRLLLRARRQPAYGRHWPERLGLGPRLAEARRIWFHTVSVGEFNAAWPIIRRLDEADRIGILVTVTTPTARALARARLPASADLRYLPLDTPGAVRRFFERTRPVLGVILETEIWPNLIAEAARQDCPMILANARLSTRSARRYQRIAGVLQPTLSRFHGILTRSEAEAARFQALGAAAEAVIPLGNLKFDVTPPTDLDPQAAALERRVGERPSWIAASTRDGEEPAVVRAALRVQQRHPDVLLILAPRHPERTTAVEALATHAGLRVQRYSAAEAISRDTDCLLIDVLGVLLPGYCIARLAFVGGSLVPTGGQNPLEPAACGCPVITGPAIDNFEEAYATLFAAGAAVSVHDPEALARQVDEWLSTPNQARAAGAAGAEVIRANRGATDRLEAYLNQLIDGDPIPSSPSPTSTAS